jgi:energy-coupling factor transporter ATP-binding protein EcfA2
MQKFIDIGWHTVPLAGKLERLEDGSKTIPDFEKDWKTKYKKTFNRRATALGGAITGEVSDIIAIDCDNAITYSLFKALDQDYEFDLISLGKGKTAGTIIYKYDSDIETKSYKDKDLELDIYSDDGFIYLPTKANKTKVTMEEIPEIREMPPTVKLLLLQLQAKNKVVEKYNTNSQSAACLAPLLTQFVGSKGEFMPSLFKVITPRQFRTEQQYQKQGYLHPENIPDGSGSDYLSRVSAILGSDESVSQELYMETMICINNLFESPMDSSRLDKTILEPMLEGRSSIDGSPIWQYNKEWAKKRFTITTKHGLIVDLGFDDQRNTYYYLDMTNELLRGFNKDNDFIAYLDVTTQSALPKKPAFKKKLPIVRITSSPSLPFGFCESDTPQVLTFNAFKPSQALTVLHHPEDYEKFYKPPVNILKYFETLVPSLAARTYLLQFIKRKMTYFEYSPVTLYFLGKPGSGKDTFVNILEAIMNHVARPTTNEFLEVYNAWLLDSYFVQLDEYGDQLTKMVDRDMVKGKWKAYTGKDTVSIRTMRQVGYPYKHNATFIFTANRNPIIIEDNDRRVHLMDTPNILNAQPWFTAEVHDKMMTEINDFCYYLATEVDMLSKTEYMNAPVSADKHTLIADSMFAAQKIAYAMNHQMWNYLVDLGLDNNCKDFAEDINKGKVTSFALEALYDELTDFKGDLKTLTKILRKTGFHIIPTSANGTKGYYILLDKDDNPFGEDDEN